MTKALSTEKPIVKVSAADTSRQIKKHLKKLFPNTKFSVRMRGGSLDISWTDGPSYNAVNEAVKVFEGAEMVQNGGDLIKGYKEYVEKDGVHFDFGIDFILCQRCFSDEMEIQVQKAMNNLYGNLDLAAQNYFHNKMHFEKSEQDILAASSIEGK